MSIDLMEGKNRDVETIMQYDLHKVVSLILEKLPDWQVSHIRQALKPDWRDGFHHSMFDKWYANDDTKSPARDWFKYIRRQSKHYPEQGWAPEDEGVVEIWECQVCGREIDDDDIFLNHFRNNHCTGFDQMVKDAIGPDDFWKKFNKLKVKK